MHDIFYNNRTNVPKIVYHHQISPMNRHDDVPPVSRLNSPNTENEIDNENVDIGGAFCIGTVAYEKDVIQTDLYQAHYDV